MKKYMLALLTCICSISILLTACGGSDNQTETETSYESNVKNSDQNTDDEGTLYGEVTAINGSEITLSLGTFEMQAPQGDGANGAPSNDDGAPPDANGDTDIMPPRDDQEERPSQQGMEGEQPPEMQNQDNTNGQGERPSGGGPGGRSFGGLTLTGAETTITVTENTVISISNEEGLTDATIDNIEVGNILSYTLEGDVVTSIVIQSPPMMGQEQGGAQRGNMPPGVGASEDPEQTETIETTEAVDENQ